MQDSKPRAVILPKPRTKIHHMRYIPEFGRNVLTLSTEDGRILFYQTALTSPINNLDDDSTSSKPQELPAANLLAQLGGSAVGLSGRVKEYDILSVGKPSKTLLFIAGSSDGAVRIWKLDADDLESSAEPSKSKAQRATGDTANGRDGRKDDSAVKQIGQLLGIYETGHRITCLKSFIMTGKPSDDDAGDVNQLNKDEEVSSSSADSG
jgi:protein MAK11